MRSFRIMLFCVQKTLKPPYNLHFLCHFLVIFWHFLRPDFARENAISRGCYALKKVSSSPAPPTEKARFCEVIFSDV